jgi:hypothetical protein
LLLDPWPNAGRRSFAALGYVEAADIYHGAPETPSLADVPLRDCNTLLLAIIENVARCRALARPLCLNGIESVKALMLLSGRLSRRRVIPNGSLHPGFGANEPKAARTSDNWCRYPYQNRLCLRSVAAFRTIAYVGLISNLKR